ncbi:hypothetical protein PQC59_gp041 [Escherichia phage vB_EcoP_IMEP8]|uniref:Uncharacterized protein n=1 Tax=Escherichia phage vB_EcoP_IMEP8 TaxID=2866663 RepID=A0AAE8Y4I7_9CAUD|nr:hypothetical protein PQC59_gp041 [Escherichia phage vB_EcoP_IMEP8]UCR91962.1 hypothetical protein [Escherichia phage vB_EcoP_IMEP8]
MNIGLDYDDTYTSDKKLWRSVVALMQAKGYDVRFVTYRFAEPNGYDNHDIKIDAECLQIPIIFCNGVQKDDVCRQLGFFVDVWIDDFPVGIPKKDHLDGMLKGVRLNDLRAAPPVEIAAPVYSEEPLVIR